MTFCDDVGTFCDDGVTFWDPPMTGATFWDDWCELLG